MDFFVQKCEHADLFWKQLQDNANDVCENAVSMNLSETFVMFGYDGNLKSDSVFDFIILLAKFFTYKWKMENTTEF